MPPEMTYERLDFGLHLEPEGLKRKLQEAIDCGSGQADVVVLGYGLCSLAVVGLKARECPLVVPKVDDCIAIFLGSHAAYLEQSRAIPGTYYLTKGWIEGGISPFASYDTLLRRYGKEDADYLMTTMLGNYCRLALIDAGWRDQERYRTYARQTAEQFGLRYEEIPGSSQLIRQMIHGPWDEDFVVAQPGEVITLDAFKRDSHSGPGGAP